MEVLNWPEFWKELPENMETSLENLKDVPSIKELPEKTQGVYVFYENEKAIYLGRSDDIRSRLLMHSRESSDDNAASFAFLLAKEELREYIEEKRKKLNKKKLSRKELFKIFKFKEAFKKAKERIKKMSIRCVEIENPIKQATFEIYAASILGTLKYNSFENH